MEFLLRTLAGSELSPNSISGSAQKRRVIASERKRLRAEAAIEIQAKYGTEIPSYPAGLVDITYRHSFKRPGDDYYRPTDCSNIGGDCIKPVIDALVDMGVLPDDDYKHVPAVILRIEKCKELTEEGYYVMVQPLVAS